MRILWSVSRRAQRSTYLAAIAAAMRRISSTSAERLPAGLRAPAAAGRARFIRAAPFGFHTISDPVFADFRHPDRPSVERSHLGRRRVEWSACGAAILK